MRGNRYVVSALETYDRASLVISGSSDRVADARGRACVSRARAARRRRAVELMRPMRVRAHAIARLLTCAAILSLPARELTAQRSLDSRSGFARVSGGSVREAAPPPRTAAQVRMRRAMVGATIGMIAGYVIHLSMLRSEDESGAGLEATTGALIGGAVGALIGAALPVPPPPSVRPPTRGRHRPGS